MLKLSLALLERGGEGRIREEISPDSPLWDGLNLALSAPVRVDLTAREVGDSVFVRGTIQASARGECRRCLAEADRQVDAHVDFLFAPMEDEDEEIDGEVYPLPDRGNELDLSAPVREQLVLLLPEYVLCQDECRGLCPKCGTDLNQGTCECVPEEKASPWEALRKLNFD